MTVGELARYFDGEFLTADAGWPARRAGRRRGQGLAPRRAVCRRPGLPWVMPSPNMPTPDTALVYPGTGMFEGTNLSEGRGTTRPFELVGAPYADYKWAERLAALDIPGAGFREAYFSPTFSKYTGQVCGGVQVHVTDPSTFDPMRVDVEMLVAAKSLYSDFAWRYDSYDPARPYWIDKLTGSTSGCATQITAGASADEVVGAWRDELAAFDAASPAVPHLPRPGRLTAAARRPHTIRSDMRLRTLVPAALGSLALAGSLVTAGPAGRATADDFSKPDRGFAPPNTVLSDASPAVASAWTRRRSPRPWTGSTPTSRSTRAVTRSSPAPSGSWATTGRIVERDASGWALRYADATTELPRDQWEPMRTDTIFDLASVSKLFTSIAVGPAHRGGARRAREPGRDIPPGVRRQRQGGR